MQEATTPRQRVKSGSAWLKCVTGGWCGVLFESSAASAPSAAFASPVPPCRVSGANHVNFLRRAWRTVCVYLTHGHTHMPLRDSLHVRNSVSVLKNHRHSFGLPLPPLPYHATILEIESKFHGL
jgi:hypothetical protein